MTEGRDPRPGAEQPPSGSPPFTGPLGYLGAVVVMAIATAAGRAFHALAAPEATVVMTFLLGVIVVAGSSGRGPAVASSLFAVLLYNFFFTAPYYTVRIDDPGHLYTFTMMLVAAIAVSELTARIRARLELARERERRFEALYRVGQRLAGMAGTLPLARAAEELLAEILPGEVVLFLSGPEGLSPALEHELARTPDELAAARKVFEGRQDGEPATATSEAGTLFLPLDVPGRRVGVLGWRPRGSSSLGEEGRRLLETFTTLIALALERDRLTDEGHRVLAQAETEKVRSGLLSGLSHDLRTPLAAITGSASALLQTEEPDPATRRALLQTIHSEAARLVRFVEKVLQMTRIHSGPLKVDAQWQPLDEVIGSALTRLDQALGTRRVRLDVPAPAPLVPMDGLLIEQVLLNLLENAISYSPPEAPIEVGARANGGEVQVWVADRGPGVASEDRERVFDMFFRSPVAGQARTEGVGLGLAISRAIMQSHGGSIAVVPNPGGGARFEVTLRRGDAPPDLERRELLPAEERAP